MIHPSNFRSNFSSPSLTCILITFPIWTRREEKKMKKKSFPAFVESFLLWVGGEIVDSRAIRHSTEKLASPSLVGLLCNECVEEKRRKIHVWRAKQDEKRPTLTVCARAIIAQRRRATCCELLRPSVHRTHHREKAKHTWRRKLWKSSAIIEAWRTTIVFWRAWYPPRCDDRGPPATGCWRDDVALEHQQQREKWKNSTFSSLKYAIFVNNVYKIHVWSSHCASPRSWVFHHFPSARSWGVGVWRFSRESRRAKKRACECVGHENSNALVAEVAYKFECSSPLLV